MSGKILSLITAMGFAVATFSASAVEVKQDKSGNVTGVFQMEEPTFDCRVYTEDLTVKNLQFSESGKTLKIIQFIDKDGELMPMPVNSDDYSNVDRNNMQAFIKENNKYTVEYQVCGMGGYLSPISIKK